MTENFQQLWGTGSNMFKSLYDDPKVTRMMSTRAGQYLSSHPVLSLTVLMFSAMAAVPVGVFFVFALSTFIMCAVGFVLFEVFLLCAGGFTLLTVLLGIAFFSGVFSVIFNVFYVVGSNTLNYYNLNQTKRGQVPGKESECDPSKLKEME